MNIKKKELKGADKIQLANEIKYRGLSVQPSNVLYLRKKPLT
jgi:hypothetical protein